MIDVHSILKSHDQAKHKRDALLSDWREISDYVRPVDYGIGTDETDSYRNSRTSNLFDTTAIDANLTYASGCMSWLTPAESHWFSFDAPERLAGNDVVKGWYSTATDITRQVLASSNFYETQHQCYLDDGSYGTCGLITEEDFSGLRFESLKVGRYSILENSRGKIDTVFRVLKLTPRQAGQKFGYQNLHPLIKKELDDNKDGISEYLHAVMPREDSDRIAGKIDGVNMPYASIYVDVKNKHLISEGGSWEMPIAVHRHLPTGNSPYGYSPAMQVMPDCRQVNVMQGYLDALLEKIVTPPILAPASGDREFDLMAGGVTFFKDEGSIPRHWNTPGNPYAGEDRVEWRQRQIKSAFHVELFQALGAVPPGKEMTAAEVHMRQRDRLTLFSPTYARKTGELATPTIKRVFALLLRAGAFPEAPNGLVQRNAEGMPFIPDPEIQYSSRLALAMKSLQTDSFTRSMQTIAPMAEFSPDILDHVNFGEATRTILRNNGVSEDLIRKIRDVELMQQQRAEQQAAQMQQESEAMQADAVSKMASSGVLATAA